MKTLSLLVAALCVTGGVARGLFPRGKNNDALSVHKPSNRGGLGRDNASPRHKVGHSEKDVERVQEAKDRSETIKLPDRSNLRKSQTPEEGVDGWVYVPEENLSKVYEGDAQEIPSRQTEGRHRHDPSEKDYAYQPRAKNKEEEKEAAKQRRHAYKGLPQTKGMVNDHKGPISSHYAKPGQVASVAIDNERSQGLEGQIFKEANAPVRENGYTDPTDKSTWKGVGGVKIIPNAKNKAPLRPEIGPPESKPYKYSVTEDSSYQIQKRKRHSTSRSSSESSDTILSKPARKANRHDPQTKRRRDIAGIGEIVSTQAAASTPQVSTQNSTNPNSEELQLYLDAWNIVKANATDIIWPFLEDMLYGTNSSLVITAAWSIYADLIPTSYVVTGPFFHGYTSLPSQEEQWATSNMTDEELQGLYDLNDVLIDLYSTAWDGASEALNSTGVLDDLDRLTQVIWAYNSSLPPDTSLDPGAEDPYAAFFLSYDSIVTDDELDFGNATANGTATCSTIASGTAIPSACFFNSTNVGVPYPNTTLATVTTRPTGIMVSGLAMY